MKVLGHEAEDSAVVSSASRGRGHRFCKVLIMISPNYIVYCTGQMKVLTNVLMIFAEDFMRPQQSSCEAEAKAS